MAMAAGMLLPWLLLAVYPALSAAAVAESGGLVQDADHGAWARECLGAYQKTPGPPMLPGFTDIINGVPTENFTVQEGFDFISGYGGGLSNWDLISMPSGLCIDSLACSFKNCKWDAEIGNALATFDPRADALQALKDQGVTLNLPDQIAFPKSVKDVVDVVEHAKANGMPVSIKTSGHSYSGSSTLAGSVQINMRDFPKYSQVPFLNSIVTGELPAVTPCNETWLSANGYEMTAACKLAAARGKPAAMRVGGGETWDGPYRAVDNANYFLKAAINQTVEVMGGGAGTVSAAGGWLQGSGLSLGYERVYGYGVDNVLELEMVLPSGQHVKFGPSEWEDAEGFLYPRTTKVQGFCNSNVTEDEMQWKWDECEEVPFEDLWYAVRGGGGGTYGVVTAVTFQVHPKRDIQVLSGDFSGLNTICRYTEYPASEKHISETKGCKELQDAFTDFWIDVLFNPSGVGISEETSNNCGNADFAFNIGGWPSYGGSLWCANGGAQEVAGAWTTYWQNYTGPVPDGVEEYWDAWLKALTISEVRSYASALIGGDAMRDSIFPEGHVADNPSAWISMPDSGWSALVPVDFFLQKNDDVHDMVMGRISGFHLAGGNVGTAQDQMTPLSQPYRISGAQTFFTSEDSNFVPLIQEFYPKPNSPNTMVGGTEYNHISSDEFGPLKDDHSTLCPALYSHAERTEKCVSVQEAVWGTETLARLESIKEAVDPEGLFQCQKCVGFKE